MWWVWLLVAGVVAWLMTRRWNPISRQAAAGEIGRRYAVLIHFWRIWIGLVAAGIVGLAVLIATHPAPSPAAGEATSPRPVASQPAASPLPSPAASPASPAVSPAPAATQSSDGHIPGPILIVIVAGLAVAIAVSVATWRRRREDDPEYWMATHAPYLADDADPYTPTGGYETGGWVAGNAPADEHDPTDPYPDPEDTPDEQHNDDDPDPGDEGGGDGPLVGDDAAVLQHPGRRRQPRHPRVHRR